MKKVLLVLMAFSMVFVAAACGGGDAGQGEEEITELTMGFIPSQEADKIADTVKPLEKALSEKLGVPVKAEVMIDFVSLVEGMRTGQIDIGFINPFGYVKAKERADVEIILKAVRYGSDTYKAQFIVPADSDIQKIEDLVNKSGLVWAYSDTLSTSGYLCPADHLMNLGVEDLETHFTQSMVGGHDNAVLAVLNGEADFATTFDDARDVLADDYPQVEEKVRVIGYTDPIPNDGIAVRSGMPAEMTQKIKEAFLSFNEDEETIKIMEEVYSWSGIAEAKDEDYKVVEEAYNRFKDQIEQ